MKEIVKTDIGYIVYNIKIISIAGILAIKIRARVDKVFQKHEQATEYVLKNGDLITNRVKTFNWL